MKLITSISSIVVAMTVALAVGADIHVDNIKGDDAVGDGSVGKPFLTIARAFKEAKTSDAVYLTPNRDPYHETIDIPVGGTAEKPLIFDGRGAVINLLTHYTEEQWTKEGDDVFSMPLPNNAHVMDKNWQGFDLVFFNGWAGRNFPSRELLEPMGYFLFKQRQKIDGEFHPLHNRLYVRLLIGRTPSDIQVEAPGIGTIVHCGQPYVTIRNLTAMYCTGDGFATTRQPGIVLERVRGCYNMDQGISHHGSQVVVRESRFDNNAGCGIVDVYPEVKVRYERCIVEDDSFRGGVELYSGEFVMEDCIIRNNASKAFLVTRGAKVVFRNCLFIGQAGGLRNGGSVWDGSVKLDHCTFYRFAEGLRVAKGCTADVNRCAFVNCEKPYSVDIPDTVDSAQTFILNSYSGKTPPWRLAPPKLSEGEAFGANLSPAIFAKVPEGDSEALCDIISRNL